MQDVTFNFDAKRARLARFGKTLHNVAVQVGLAIFLSLLVLGGISLVLAGSPVGWLVASLAGPVAVFWLWSRSLTDLPVIQNSGIDGVLDTFLLARLPENPTPKQLAQLATQTPGGNFYGARFMIGFAFLEAVASDQAHDTTAIWQLAETYRAKYGFRTINGAVLVVALIQSSPDTDEFLAHVGISKDEILEGLAWYQHINELIADSRKHHDKGGIGRDWAFGYIPLLDRFGFNITEHVTYSGLLSRELESRTSILGHVAQTLSQSGRRNVALVGQLGSGKTKLVYTLAEQFIEADARVPRNLHFHQVIALDPSTLIATARGRGELEHLVQQLCIEALRAKNIILFLDDAHLFFEEGTGSVDLSNVLLPILDGGALRIILAMDEQRWTRIAQTNPSLTQYLNRVMVPPTNQQDTTQIMQNQLVLFEHQQKVTYTYQALQAAYNLSSRFIAEQVMPGRALKLLEAAASYANSGLVTKASVEQAIEQTQGVKVGTADTATERTTLLNLEDLIHRRMINQTRAVQVVSDALRRARAGVRNTNKPIGTFLFLGPTGVGKTELAKSVAATFFEDESRLVRLDLNEYVRSEDVSRLIADPAQDTHSLTAQISRQPFSVVLLDEIEKAHPEVLNTLLQLLDEGILRDINNREVSFRDAVIIATSNAGADRIRSHIEAGEKLEQFEQQFVNELISSNVFRPEFLNRFDEIVLFRPLEPNELLQVVDLILTGINKTLADQKLSVEVAQDAKELLVQVGNDPRLGARPMRRMVQRTVENIVANQVLAQQATPGSVIYVSKDDVARMLER